MIRQSFITNLTSASFPSRLCRQIYISIRLRPYSRPFTSKHVASSPLAVANEFEAQETEEAKANEARLQELIEKRKPVKNRVDKEVETYWQARLNKIKTTSTDPVAKGLCQYVNPKLLLGLPDTHPEKSPSAFQTFRRSKMEHPFCVVVIKVGEFYEMTGTDAVIAVAYCGLNPMGDQPFPDNYFPRAGCRLPNLQSKLDNLTRAGFSVAVYEEEPEIEDYYGRKKPVRIRRLGGIVTPSLPRYISGAISKDFESFMDESDPIPPQLGVSFSDSSGVSLCLVDLGMGEYTLLQRATVETVTAHLHQGGTLLPLFVHNPGRDRITGKNLRAINVWRSYLKGISSCGDPEIEIFEHPNFVTGLIQKVVTKNNMSPTTKFRQKKFDNSERPHGLFLCTAQNLGLVRNPGVLSLADTCLQNDCLAKVKNYMTGLLKNPPPSSVGASIREAVQILAGLETPMPEFKNFLAAESVPNLLEGGEVNVQGFYDLWTNLDRAATLLSSELKPLGLAILPAVETDVGSKFPAETLLPKFRKVQEVIQGVIDIDNVVAQSQREHRMAETDDCMQQLIQHEAYEGKLYGRVLFGLLEKEFLQVKNARTNLRQVLEEVILDLRAADKSRKTLKDHQPCQVYDKVNRMIWIGTTGNTPAHHAAQTSANVTDDRRRFYHPTDRKGLELTKVTLAKAKKSVWTTRELSEAISEYRAACGKARSAIEVHLRDLSKTLESHILELRAAISFNIITAALESHTRQASNQNWVEAQQLLPGEGPDRTMRVKGFWPYWKEAWDQGTVFNDVTIDGTNILTGPNMAGKSTAMRSLCAIAVLSACGLRVPAQEATLPYIDSFTLRTFSADSPVEGLSAFAIEMLEMSHVLESATGKSLVLLDELGKGTEPDDGTAIAAAFIERLSKLGCSAIFATHLHMLLDMKAELAMDRVTELCMGTQQTQLPSGETVLTPTFKVLPGQSRESLAIPVMHDHCQDAPLRDRAINIREKIQARRLSEAAGRSLDVGKTLDAADPLSATPETANAEAFPLEEEERNVRLMGIEPSHTCSIHEAAEALVLHVKRELSFALGEDRQLAALQEVSPPDDDSSFGTISDEEANGATATRDQRASLENSTAKDVKAQIVLPGSSPPPSTTGKSGVYVWRNQQGEFYFGQSDKLTARVKQHRRKTGKGGPNLELAYVILPDQIQGSSHAKFIEGQLCRYFSGLGRTVLSVKDAGNKVRPQ